MVLLVILWIVSPFAAAAIASGKRRDAFGWFMLGLLLSIFAVLIVACLRPLTEQEALRAKLGPDAPIIEKTCPRCAETVKSEAKVCRFCGHEFEGAPTVPAPLKTT